LPPKVLLLCHAASTRSVPGALVPAWKPLPMLANLCWPRGNSPPGQAGCSYSSPIWYGLAAIHGLRAPNFRARAWCHPLMPCGPRLRSSCGRSSARAMSWRWWPTRGSRCSVGSTPCPRKASCQNTPPALPRRRFSTCWHYGTSGLPEAHSAANRSISTFTLCRISATIRRSNPTIWPSEADANPASWCSCPRPRCPSVLLRECRYSQGRGGR
jgi:hypothetical protein